MSEPLRDAASRAKRIPGEDPEYTDPEAPGPGLPPPNAVESLVSALLEAGPDVAEHVVRSAQELLLAAQVIVDAANKAVREQQELRRSGAVGDAAAAPGAAAAPAASASVRHLDVAE